jgi:hypothetical protein
VFKKILSAVFLFNFLFLSLTAEEISPTSFLNIAHFIKKHNKLPDNFITKKDAKKLGWSPSRNHLSDVAPGKSIGGDVFMNHEKKLPYRKGRIWREADIDYKKGRRNGKRILYSDDGLIYKTEDHYKTFQEIRL